MKKKKNENKQTESESETEILKAVAQAWLGRSGSSTSATEYDAHRRNSPSKPSRFKLEAAAGKKQPFDSKTKFRWDFNQSLLDSYEIVAVSKRIERGLLLADTVTDTPPRRKRKESKNSLRRLFSLFSSSSRFNQVDFPPRHT